MNYLPSSLIIVALASQAMIWHSLSTIRDAIQQTNAVLRGRPKRSRRTANGFIAHGKPEQPLLIIGEQVKIPARHRRCCSLHIAEVQ